MRNFRVEREAGATQTRVTCDGREVHGVMGIKVEVKPREFPTMQMTVYGPRLDLAVPEDRVEVLPGDCVGCVSSRFSALDLMESALRKAGVPVKRGVGALGVVALTIDGGDDRRWRGHNGFYFGMTFNVDGTLRSFGAWE
jgi:hypothetical protein